MYYCVTGKLLHVEPYLAVVSCGGVGYKCMTTMTTLSCLPPAGGEVTLYTHLNVREDALDLYGFYTQAERTAFQMLIGVSGVGPKSALAVLSDMTPDQLSLAVAFRATPKSLRNARASGRRSPSGSSSSLRISSGRTGLPRGCRRSPRSFAAKRPT